MNKKWAVGISGFLLAVGIGGILHNFTFAQAPSFFGSPEPPQSAQSPTNTTEVQSLSPSDFQKQVEEQTRQNQDQAKQEAAQAISKSTPPEQPMSNVPTTAPAESAPAPIVEQPSSVTTTPPPAPPETPAQTAPTTEQASTPSTPTPATPPTASPKKGGGVYTGFGTGNETTAPASQGQQGKTNTGTQQSPGWNIRY